jgi:exopolyphosphatase/guanosine-5'-triphosphate,3'-diphosphate pyrophosphatase
LLEYAALLHDVGYHISHSGHHKHSRYLIENADFLGFQADEGAIIANVARYHRKSHPKPTHEPFQRLTANQQQRVRELASILRIAEGLDRSHFQNAVALEAELDERRLKITVETKSDPQLEVWGALHDAAFFEETFGREVEASAGAVQGDAPEVGVPAFDEAP